MAKRSTKPFRRPGIRPGKQETAAEVRRTGTRIDLQSMTDRMRAVAAAAAGVIGAESREVLRTVLEEACGTVIPFDAFFVMGYDPENHTFHGFGGRDTDTLSPPNVVTATGTPGEWVVRHRKTMLVDSSDDPRGQGAHLTGTGRRSESVIRAPILSGEEVLGLLSVQSYQRGLYTDEDVEIIEVIASLAATAILNLRLNEKREAAEETLREKEHQLGEAQRIARLGSWTWVVDANEVTWSDELYRIYGLDRDRFGADFESYLELVHEDDRARVRKRIEAALETGKRCEFEERIVRPDGTERILNSFCEGVRDGEGRIVRLVGVCQDVTEMKAAEAALRSSEESYRTIFELASDAIFVHDIETGAILDANRRACELHGCTLEELKQLGVPGISEGVPPYDGEHARTFIRRAAEGDAQRFEWRVKKRSGEAFWVEVSLHRVRILGDLRVLASVRNIDERKRAEEMLQHAHDVLEQRVEERTAELASRSAELEDAEKRFRAIVEASPTPLVLSRVDDGVILYANERLERLIGVGPGGLTGKKTTDFYYDPSDRPRVVQAIREAGEVRGLELHLRRADGTPIWVSLSVQQMTFDDQHALATALIDITEQKSAQEALRFQKTLLEAQGEASIDGILVVSDEGKMLSYNQRFVEMWNIPTEVLESKSDDAAIKYVLDQLSHPEEFRRRVEYLYAHPQEQSRDEIELRDDRVFDRYTAPVVSAEGHYYGRIWFFRDITVQKRYTEVLDKALREAERATEQASHYAAELERELDVGRRIQRSFLATTLPQPEGWEIAARFRPASRVAGDFYDVFELKDQIGCVIADVCGKGVGAALFMALFQSLLRANAERVVTASGGAAPPPDRILAEAMTATNGYTTRVHKPTHMFASVFFGLLDPACGVVHYVNAGHDPPVIMRGDGSTERLTPGGPALGLIAGASWDVGSATIGPGELMAAFTDGVTEARNDDRDFYTEERLLDLLRKPAESAASLLDRIEKSVDRFAGEAPPHDDLTLLAVRRVSDR